MIIKGGYSAEAKVKDLDMKKGIVTGYASQFNSIDSDGDIIMPGAFTKTIKEQGPGSHQPRIKHLLNHNTTQPIGNPLMLAEDTNGLYYESQIGTHALGVDFLKMVDSGLISEHSIGFATVKQKKEKDANHIHEVRLFEFSSLTAWGANGNTPLLGVKNFSDRIEKLKKAIHSGTFTDASFEILIQELDYLQKEITKPEPVSTQPINEYINILQQFKLN